MMEPTTDTCYNIETYHGKPLAFQDFFACSLGAPGHPVETRFGVIGTRNYVRSS